MPNTSIKLPKQNIKGNLKNLYFFLRILKEEQGQPIYLTKG